MTFYLKCEENGYARFVENGARLSCTNFVLTVHSGLGGGDDNSKEIS
jgi:hypothetical protein